VLNLFKFKHINEGKLLKIIKNYKKVIIYDECTYWGGFTPIVSSLLIKNKLKINLNILSSPDKQLFKYSQNRDEIHEYLKISPKYLRKLF
jgi:transketolase C-terminal domain/subunit